MGIWSRIKHRIAEEARNERARGVFRKPRFVRKYPVFSSVVGLVLVAGLATFAFFYIKYAMLIQEKFGGGSIRTNSSVYALPRQVAVGDTLAEAELIARLQRAGYTEDQNNKLGYYQRTPEGLLIATGPYSYFQPHSAVVQINGDRIVNIVSKTDNRVSKHYWLEPELITNLFDRDREKRRPVAYSEVPKHLVEALISVEDKRFFKHTGMDPIRMVKAAYVDIKEGRKEQGASTITMQLARSFWLDQDKTYTRKMAEILLTMELERRFTKEQILEFYVNEVYLGRRGSFSIHGFGEAARAYFAKDIRKLTLPEAATLVAMIQRPSYFNPFRYPERVKERRNLALMLMHTNGYIDAAQYAQAINAPLVVSPGETESSDAPYFVDLVNADLDEKFKDWDFATNSYRVYSTLDLDLQEAAVAAVQEGMAELDKNLQRMRGKRKKGPYPQVALVALDPETGDIRALVGGRSYTDSQLNRALAKRQPGSAFKPFVYATALNQSTVNNGRGEVITAASRFLDEPTTFTFNRQEYQPANYHDQYYGNVTIRQALAKSMNIPVIKVAEKIGFEKVANVARSAGIKSPIMGTPSLALGSYEMMPIELAEAYTIFANKGVHIERAFVTSIRDRKNKVVFTHQPKGSPVLDERVAFIMTNLMEEVMRSGTAAGARSKRFTVRAAGKTGSSRDGWVAGYTSKLLTVVWIGYDDNTEFEMEAARSALPVWTTFMKRAHALRQYGDAKPFEAPKGIVKVNIDPHSGLLAGPSCPSRVEYFIPGTQPRSTCDHYDDYYSEDGTPVAEITSMPRRTNVFKSMIGIFR
ncbi:MAG TPA: PBP1A family penicillin-binding protein [Bryobacteraceae bacterium]|nr:PBP1A family penicillin-binding protein [Bryobacteraceae bacterium]